MKKEEGHALRESVLKKGFSLIAKQLCNATKKSFDQDYDLKEMGH